MQSPEEILADAKKTMFHISGVAYSDVQKLQVALDKVGIENNISTGGLCIYPKGHYKVLQMKKICRLFKATPIKGETRIASDTILGKYKIKPTPFPKI